MSKQYDFRAIAKKLGFDELTLSYQRRYAEQMERESGFEGDEFIRTTVVTLLGRKWDGDCEYVGDPVELGHFTFMHFLADYALNTGHSIWDEADSIDGDMEFVAAVLYGRERAGVAERLRGLATYSADALYVHAMYLKPEARGYGLANAVINRAVEQITAGGNIACVAAMPKACWHTSVVAGDPLHGRNEDARQQSLERHFEKMGFRHEDCGIWVKECQLNWRAREGVRKSRRVA